MAIQFTSWESDGDGQFEIAHIRSDQKDWHSDSNAWIESQKKNLNCVLITKSRTDNQSNREWIIWQRPGYLDPCTQLKD